MLAVVRLQLALYTDSGVVAGIISSTIDIIIIIIVVIAPCGWTRLEARTAPNVVSYMSPSALAVDQEFQILAQPPNPSNSGVKPLSGLLSRNLATAV